MRRPPPFYALRGIVSSRVFFFLLYFGLGKKSSSSFIFSFISLKWLAAAAGSAVSSLLPGLRGVLPCHRRGTLPLYHRLPLLPSLLLPFILHLTYPHIVPAARITSSLRNGVASQSCVRSSCRCPLSTTGSISLNRLPHLPRFICLFHPILHTGRLYLRNASSSLFLLRLNPA